MIIGRYFGALFFRDRLAAPGAFVEGASIAIGFAKYESNGRDCRDCRDNESGLK